MLFAPTPRRRTLAVPVEEEQEVQQFIFPDDILETLKRHAQEGNVSLCFKNNDTGTFAQWARKGHVTTGFALLILFLQQQQQVELHDVVNVLRQPCGSYTGRAGRAEGSLEDSTARFRLMKEAVATINEGEDCFIAFQHPVTLECFAFYKTSEVAYNPQFHLLCCLYTTWNGKRGLNDFKQMEACWTSESIKQQGLTKQWRQNFQNNASLLWEQILRQLPE
jgi:hypothetical protein